MTTPIIALDVPTMDTALAVADQLDGLCHFYKVGMELFTAAGPRVVKTLRERKADVFLDLKFHDIPNTVKGGVERAAAMGARLVTVHAAGGRSMLEAAQAAAQGTECGVLAVTVLTSLDAGELAATWGRDAATMDVGVEVLRLAGVAAETGLHGVVCSGREAQAVRERYGSGLATLVPGVRLAGSGANDQARVVTPGAAVAAGARYVVIGRTVTAAADPRAAMERVVSELAAAGGSRLASS